MTKAEQVLEALRSEFTCKCGQVHPLPEVTTDPHGPIVRKCQCGMHWSFLRPRAADFRARGLVVHDEESGWSSWPSTVTYNTFGDFSRRKNQW